MKRLIALTVLTAALLLGACGGHENKLTEGVVVGRDLTPERDWMQMICAGYNSQSMCTVNVPIWHHEDAEFYLVIEGEHEGETLRERHRVTVDEYNEFQRGVTFHTGVES